MADLELNATLIERKVLNEELHVLKVKPDWGHIPEFQPGQFATLGLPHQDDPPAHLPEEVRQKLLARGPRMLRRAYSIASSGTTRDYIELYITLVGDGRFTPKLWQLEEGDKLWMDTQIKGFFTMEKVPDNKDLVMVSTGTGLAPYISMLRTYRGQDRWRKFIIIHGARYSRDLGYSEELSQIAEEDESVIYIPSVTRDPEDSGFTGIRGRIPVVLEDETYQKYVGAPLCCDHCHVFLCGNPEMVNSVKDDLVANRGFTADSKDEDGNVHEERYW